MKGENVMIKQISIFVENKFGRLASIIDALGKNNIDISALSIADTTDFGILRIIVDKPEEAVLVLKENGVAVKCTDVIAVAIDDTPGGLSKVLEILTKEDITIDYMYAFVGKKEGKALMVVKTDDLEKTEKILSESKTVTLADIKDIY